MTEHDASPQVELLTPQGPSAKQIAKEVLTGINPISHGEAISSLEHIAQLRGLSIATTEGIPLASATWTTANAVVYMPVVVREPIIIKQLRLMNGATAAGNIDLGIYASDNDGLPSTRLVSTGEVAQSDVAQIQKINVTATSLSAALYYLACVLSSASGTTFSLDATVTSWNADQFNTYDGVFQELSASPLPATATPTILSAARRTPLMYAARHQF